MNNFLSRGRLYFAKGVAWFRSLTIFKKFLFAGISLIALVGLGVLSFVFLVWIGFFGRLPDKEELSMVENPAASEVYTADSVLLGRYFIQERSNIHYEDIPKHVEQALIATEDIRFYDHHGIDTKSLLRVLFKSILLQKESSGGGSTITQQLAKNLYPRKQYKYLSLPINKIREMIIAWRFESIYDKKAILTLYLNTIPFGDNAYGIEAASQRYFSVPTRKLSVAQGAVLVGMLKATYMFNPRLFPKRAEERRNVVLAQMNKYNFLDTEKVRKYQSIPLKLSYSRITHHTGVAPYFREFIRQELMEWCKNHTKRNGEPYNLYTDGLKVYTTLDSRMQVHAEEAVDTRMAEIQKKFNSHWAGRDPWYKQPQALEDAIKRSERYKSLQAQGLSDAEIKKVMRKPVAMTIFTWEGEEDRKMSPIDSVKHYLKFLNAGFMAMEPGSGAVRAWVGGINHNYFQYDHVKPTTRRQVGSTFKPLVYAAALERGASPCEFISAEKTTYTNVANMREWSPQNTDDNYDLEYSLGGALAYSVNTVSVKVLEIAGINNTINLARKMGIKSTMPAVPSLALGVADISMPEMIASYACFVNKGKAVEPFYITSITDHRGSVLQQFKGHVSKKPVLSPETAEMMIQMLRRTVNEGTGGNLRWQYGVNNDLGGKTGTTQSNADGWFICVSPNLVTGAWVGADDPRIRFRSTQLGQGSSTALPIVAKFYQEANKDGKMKSYTQAKFQRPSADIEKELACPSYKLDETFWEKIFGKPEQAEETRRDFGEESVIQKRKGFFKRLFGKSQ